MDDAYYLDPSSIRRAFNVASRTFDAASALHTEVRKRAIERLRLLRTKPQVILDLGAGTGHGSLALKRDFSHTAVIALDSSTGMLRESRHQQSWRRKFLPVAGDAMALPLKNASIDWVFSNLMLQWCPAIDDVFAEIRRVLKPGGVFSFTTLGPDSLKELRQAWGNDPHPHVNAFADMHDLGDALVRARFAEPVMDVEHFTLTYLTARELLAELKATGSGNWTQARRRTLTGRTRFKLMLQRYEQQRIEGRISASIEVVYGQAWQPLREQQHPEDGLVRIPLEQIRGSRRK